MRVVDYLKLNTKNDASFSITFKTELGFTDDTYFYKILEECPDCKNIKLINYVSDPITDSWIPYLLKEFGIKITIEEGSPKVVNLLKQVEELNEEEFSEFLGKLLEKL